MDLSGMPHLSPLECQILAASENKEMFIEKFQDPPLLRRSPSALSNIHMTQQGGGDVVNGNGTLRLLNLRNKGFAVRDSHEFESRVIYNGIPIPVKIPVAILPETVGDVTTPTTPTSILTL